MHPQPPGVEPHGLGLGQVHGPAACGPTCGNHPNARTLVSDWGWVKVAASVVMRLRLAQWPMDTPWLKWHADCGAAVVDPYVPEGRKALVALGLLDWWSYCAHARCFYV